MYAETSQKKMSNARIAFALLCGLAVCCSVMYITADAGDEYMHEVVKGHDAGTSVDTTDTIKAGQIYTETPDGRMRLMDYFNNVEKEISDEVANRKTDIAAVRAQMARDFAFNAASRAKLKRNMLHKMAQYAKKARDDLNHAMMRTQERFAKQAALANRRYKATLRRDKRTNKLIKHDKREAAKNLKLAVDAWQKSTTAWASATNARIDQMNKHVAANAAQIKENAKKARKDLEVTMKSWDHKVMNFKKESAAARSKLSEQFAAQDKAQRAWASNKIKGLVASTSAQFQDVETKMAKNRHEVDMALKRAVMRFEASLNAQKALEDKRYAETVANIAAAKKEAEEKTKAASSEFKVQLLALSSTVKEQVAKVNARIDKTAGVVRSDAAAQAKVNANVNAEMTRMVKLGNHRYVQHLKDDAELQTLISKDKEATDEQMNKMALEFNQALASVRNELAKDRKHAEDKLEAGTSSVWAKMKENQDMQAKKNAEMAAATRRMKLDAMDAVRKAKAEFQKKIKDLGHVVAENDKKADAKIKHLTGVVDEEAAKSKRGREELAAMEEANKNELKHAIRKAIETGEKRAKLVEKNGEKMDKDTQWLVNNKLSTEISKLKEETNMSVEALANLTEEARAEMRKEMIYAIRSAADVAKQDLELAIKEGTEKMVAFEAKAAAQHADSEAAREALKATIADNAKEISTMIKDAVDTDAQAQSALQTATAAKLKKTNTQIDAVSAQMKEMAKEARANIAALNKKTLADIATEQERATNAVSKFASDDAARQKSALSFMEEQLKIAGEEVDAKFGAAYEKLADDRADAENALAGAVNGLNDALAKQAALADSRFEKTVSDINAARKEATEAVAELRSDFASELITTTALVKRIDTDLNDRIAVVSGEVISYKSFQTAVNRRVKEEKERIEELSNKRFSDSKKARGKLRKLMDENKQAAAAEVAALAKELDTKLDKARAKNAHNRREMAKDLTGFTQLFYEKLSDQQKAHQEGTDALNAATAAASAAAAAELKRSQDNFDAGIVMLTNLVASNAKHAESEMSKLTGIVHNIGEAAEKDRDNIRKETAAMEADLNKALSRAIAIGEAKAKAVEQRIAEHLKGTKRFLQVELSAQVEEAADNVMDILEGKRQKIADNYLSFKAYAVAAADKVEDYVSKGQGRGMSSIGDLCLTVGSLGAVHAPAEEGVGMGGDELPAIFSGKTIKVSNAVGAINGLVNEFTESASQVRNRWPMGLGKYLLERLEASMMDKGVLQVDKIEGKSGNFVFINGRSVGLSNKLSDFGELAASMSTYEQVLAKLTAKVVPPAATPEQKPYYVTGSEWDGD